MAQRVLAVIETVSFLAAVLLPGGSFFRRMNRLLDARHEVQAVVPQEQVTENIPLEDWEPDFDLLTLAEMEGDGSWVPTEDFVFSPAVPSMTREFHYNVVDLHEAPEQPIPIWYTINQDGTGRRRPRPGWSGNGPPLNITTTSPLRSPGQRNFGAIPWGSPPRRMSPPPGSSWPGRGTGCWNCATTALWT